MNIGIVTFINTINYGALLQAYALQEKIRDLGENPEIIQYTNELIEKKEKNSKPYRLGHIIKKVVMGKATERKIHEFELFEAKNIIKGRKLTSDIDNSDINRYYDMFITGSDQVWNMTITHEDWIYFLSFVEDNRKKVSYAASFGNNEFPYDKREKAALLLKQFNAISVREQSGADFIKELTNIDATVVMDPTLLLTRKECITKTKYIPSIEKYILVYFPHDKKRVFAFTKRLQKLTGLPIVYISISPRPQFGVKTIYDASPDEFLGWILNATYVVTGSFHGTAFSLNLEKQFFYEPSGKGSRIDNLVNITGTVNRSIDSFQSLDNMIDYIAVSKKIDLVRNKSIEWLNSALHL